MKHIQLSLALLFFTNITLFRAGVFFKPLATKSRGNTTMTATAPFIVWLDDSATSHRKALLLVHNIIIGQEG